MFRERQKKPRNTCEKLIEDVLRIIAIGLLILRAVFSMKYGIQWRRAQREKDERKCKAKEEKAAKKAQAKEQRTTG